MKKHHITPLSGAWRVAGELGTNERARTLERLSQLHLNTLRHHHIVCVDKAQVLAPAGRDSPGESDGAVYVDDHEEIGCFKSRGRIVKLIEA